ncbi:MAG: DUF2007 domain-containing protein [Pseudomonadota bacterium]|nr:DUF2007 domain-containing protein [Pseudomonadota bacterium]
MRTVYHALNPIDAHLVKHALEDAGIPAFVFGEHLLGAMGELLAGGFIVVRVADHDREAAEALVNALPMVSGEPVADDDEEDDTGDDEPPSRGWLSA